MKTQPTKTNDVHDNMIMSFTTPIGLSQEAAEHIEMLMTWGWTILPVPYGEKHPIIKWKKYQTQQPTLDELKSWWCVGSPPCNYCVITGELSGVVVVDIDGEEAKRYVDEHCPQPNMWVHRKPDHWHYYYRYPTGLQFKDKPEIRNKAGYKVNGLDIRGEGGLVIGPMSVRNIDDNGNKICYEPCGFWTISKWENSPVFDPKWFDITTTKSNVQYQKTAYSTESVKCISETSTGDWYRKYGSTIATGTRNQSLFCAACDYKALHTPIDAAIAELMPIAMASGLEEPEILNTIKSAYSGHRTPSISQVTIDAITQINVPITEYNWDTNGGIPRNPFPTKCLPPEMQKYVEALSHHRTADQGFTATGLLVAISAYLNNVCVAVDNDWIIPPTLYALTIAPPAQQKGVSTSHIYDTVEMWENKKTFEREEKLKECDKKKESIKKQIESNNNAIRQYQRQLSSSKVTEIEIETLQHQVKALEETNTALEASMDELYAWYLPRGFILQESTVQWMLKLMKTSNHRGLLFSSEATPLKRAVLGRGGADDSSVDRWKDMWDGKTCTYGSIAQDDTLTVTRAALSAYLCIQPKLMKKIMKHDEFGSGGLGSRFLVTYRDEDAVVGSNSTVPTDILEWLNSLIYNLAYIPVQWDDVNKRPEPRQIKFSAEASETLHELEKGLVDTVNIMRRKGGDSHQQAILRRLKPQVMKIALILHFVRHLKLKTPDVFESPWNMLDYSDSPFCCEISDEDTQNAITLVSWYYREWRRWMDNPNRECEQVASIIWKWLTSRKKNDWVTINALVSKGPLRCYTTTTTKMGVDIGKHELANEALSYLIENEDRPIELDKSRKGSVKIRLKSKQ